MIKNIIGAKKKKTLAVLLITNLLVVNIDKPHRAVHSIRKIFCYYFYRQQ